MFFDKDYEINFEDIDCREIGRPSAFFTMIQDAAVEHAVVLHISREELGCVWVLSRLRLTMKRPLRVNERVHMRTWCAGTKGPNWLRGFSLSVDGENVGTAYSTWVTLDPVGRRILRPTQLPLHDDIGEHLYRGEFVLPGKLKLDEAAPHHVHTVRYSDLDINGHMNNVKIVDVICDGLDLEQREGLFIDDLQVNYVSECMPGEEICLSTGLDDKGHTAVYGKVGDKMKFEASAHFAPYTA